MTDRDLLSFVNKFKQLLNDGKMAKLVMDCEAGCVRVNLEVFFQPAHHPLHREQQQPHHQVHKRAAGPARQRRRVRRAQAREAADQAGREQERLKVSKAPSDPVDELNSVEAPHHKPPDTVEHTGLHPINL